MAKAPMFTKRHYEVIADLMASNETSKLKLLQGLIMDKPQQVPVIMGGLANVYDTVLHFCRVFKRDNPAFDPERFCARSVPFMWDERYQMVLEEFGIPGKEAARHWIKNMIVEDAAELVNTDDLEQSFKLS